MSIADRPPSPAEEAAEGHGSTRPNRTDTTPRAAEQADDLASVRANPLVQEVHDNRIDQDDPHVRVILVAGAKFKSWYSADPDVARFMSATDAMIATMQLDEPGANPPRYTLGIDGDSAAVFDLDGFPMLAEQIVARLNEASAPDRDAALARALPSAAGVPVEAVAFGELHPDRGILQDLPNPVADAFQRAAADHARDHAHGLSSARLSAMELMARAWSGGGRSAVLASGAQAGAAGDRPVAAPAGGLPGVGPTMDRWAFAQKVNNRLRYGGVDLTDEQVSDTLDAADAIRHRLSAAGTGDAGRDDMRPSLARETQADRQAADNALYIAMQDMDAPTRVERARAAATQSASPAEHPVEVKTVGLTYDPSRLYTLPDLDDAVAAMEPGLHTGEAQAQAPARVADDLAYCSEIDAALADKHGSSVIAAPARSTAADGLREAAHPDAIKAALAYADHFLMLSMAYSTARIEAWEEGTFSDAEHADARRDLRIEQGKHAELERDFCRWWAPRDGTDGPIRALDAAPSADRGVAGDVSQAVSEFGLGECPEIRNDDPVAFDSWTTAYNIAEHMRGHGAHDETEYLERLAYVARECVSSLLNMHYDPTPPTPRQEQTP